MPLLKLLNHLHCTLYPNFNCILSCEDVTELMDGCCSCSYKNLGNIFPNLLFPYFAIVFDDSNLVWGVRLQHNIDFLKIISLCYELTQHTVHLIATRINIIAISAVITIHHRCQSSRHGTHEPCLAPGKNKALFVAGICGVIVWLNDRTHDGMCLT